MKLELTLVGALAGRNVKLAGVKFTGGRTTLVGSEPDIAGMAKYLRRCYQALPEDSEKLARIMQTKEMVQIYGQYQPEKSPERISDDEVQGQSGEQDGQGIAQAGSDDVEDDDESQEAGAGSIPEGAGHEDSRVSVPAAPTVDDPATPQIDEKLKVAIASLDPDNNDHWTRKGGQPAVAAVAELVGRTDVTRRDIEAAAPGYGRSDAIDKSS